MSEQTKHSDNLASGQYPAHVGMTLRDSFAALAMQAIIAHPSGHAGMWDQAATCAYEAADAMLKAREA